MARFGTWAPLAANWASQSRLTTPDIICLHTMVGSLAGTDAYFRRNGYGGTFSHFGIGGDGSCTQWQDTDFRAAANLNGNHRIISVECADIGPPFAAWNTGDGSAVPAFSDAQITTLAELIATIAPAHGIPKVLIPDALPGRRGIGYHRLGVPGYMAPGAEQWSSAQGKVCPGVRRIAQIPQVIALANSGSPQEEDMTPDQAWTLNNTSEAVGRLEKAAYTQGARVDALMALVQQLATRQGTPIDMAAVEATVQKGVADAIQAIETTVTVKPGP